MVRVPRSRAPRACRSRARRRVAHRRVPRRSCRVVEVSPGSQPTEVDAHRRRCSRSGSAGRARRRTDGRSPASPRADGRPRGSRRESVRSSAGRRCPAAARRSSSTARRCSPASRNAPFVVGPPSRRSEPIPRSVSRAMSQAGWGLAVGRHQDLGPRRLVGTRRLRTQHQDPSLVGVAEPAAIGRHGATAPDHDGDRLRGSPRGHPSSGQVGRQVRVEVVGAERADTAPHRVVGDAVELEQPAIGATGEALRATGELRPAVDAGDHVHADQRPSRRRGWQGKVGEGLVEVEVGGGIGPEAVDAEVGHGRWYPPIGQSKMRSRCQVPRISSR